MTSGLKAARIASGLTQAELSKQSGVSRLTIHRAEGGKNVSVPVLKRLARTLNTTIDSLVNCDAQDHTPRTGNPAT